MKRRATVNRIRRRTALKRRKFPTWGRNQTFLRTPSSRSARSPGVCEIQHAAMVNMSFYSSYSAENTRRINCFLLLLILLYTVCADLSSKLIRAGKKLPKSVWAVCFTYFIPLVVFHSNDSSTGCDYMPAFKRKNNSLCLFWLFLHFLLHLYLTKSPLSLYLCCCSLEMKPAICDINK